MLRTLPHDGPAERDAGRAAQAAGEFEYSAEALEKAHHFEGHKRRSGAALPARRGAVHAGARRTRRRASTGSPSWRSATSRPSAWRSSGWRASTRVAATTCWPIASTNRCGRTRPAFDAEVGLNQADAHVMNEDWDGAGRVLRRYLTRDPKNVRGREMLAWALEVKGDLDAELAVRRGLADDAPTAANRNDYGRALERAANYPAARTSTRPRSTTATGPTTRSRVSYDRMHFRMTPELSGGGWFRSDSQAWDWRAQAGGALPFGPRHQAGFLVWHDASTDWNANEVVGPTSARGGSVTGLGARHARRAGGRVAGSGRRHSLPQRHRREHRPACSSTARPDSWRAGAQAEVDAPLGASFRSTCTATTTSSGANRRSPSRRVAPTTASPRTSFSSRAAAWCCSTAAAQLRRLTLAPRWATRADRRPGAVLHGATSCCGTTRCASLRGEFVDERMVRRAYLNDAGVLSYRHYQLFTDRRRPTRASRSRRARRSTTCRSFIRKVCCRGASASICAAAVGYDNERRTSVVAGGRLAADRADLVDAD